MVCHVYWPVCFCRTRPVLKPVSTAGEGPFQVAPAVWADAHGPQGPAAGGVCCGELGCVGCAFPILCFQSLCLLYHHHTVHFTRCWMPMIGCWQKVTFTRRLTGDSGKRTSRLPFPKGISTRAVWMNWSLCGPRKLTDGVFLGLIDICGLQENEK
jgi:hypothetical protein